MAATSIPFGVGKLTGRWWTLAVIALATFGVGVYAWIIQLSQGDVVTGMRDIGTGAGAAWGIYIVFVVYFIGVSFAGITVAALIRVMNLERLKPVARMAELLTVIALLLGAISIIVDLGQPGRGVVNLFLYARPQSPFFGTFSLVVSAYLFASLAYLYLEGRKDAAMLARKPGGLQGFYRLWAAGYKDTPQEQERHSRTSWGMALAILPLLVIAHSTLGFVFGIQVGRPGWFSAAQAPGFVILAGVSGTGILIVVAALVRKVAKLQKTVDLGIFRWLGNFMFVLTTVYVYLMAAELVTANYAASGAEREVSSALLSGPYAPMFWGSVALLVIPLALQFGQFVSKRYSIGLTVASAIMVNVAAIGKRFLIVVPSQTHGTLLPYDPGTYSPTWVEIMVVLGLVGLGTFLFIGFMKLFPITDVEQIAQGGE